MTEIEKKAALALFPYFSKYPVVVDVGSNKGDWSEVLIANTYVQVLFEPNTILRHYSQVRFRQYKHVNYIEDAVSDKAGEVDFCYFEDEHDGLSNIIGNDKWSYLEPKFKKVYTTNLDSWFFSHDLDFIKIDVEGAELQVLIGCKTLLSNRKVKFIQVEYAEHIHVTGHRFTEIVDFVEQFGYALFHFWPEGDKFIKVIGDPFHYNAENFYIMDANFSQDWNKDFIKNTKGMKFDFVLEIGAFEGLTTKYICENLLRKEGRVIAVDPLTDEYLPGHKDNAMFVGQYERFTRNTRGLPVELIRKTSSDAFQEMKDYRFGLIYIDGDHREQAVYDDAQRAFFLCLVGGYILFDDYDGYDEGTKRGIDKFLSEMPTNKMTVVHKGYQVMVQKHENLV